MFPPLYKLIQTNQIEDNYFTIPTERKISELRDIIENNYSDILKLDFSKKENNLIIPKE